MGMSQLSINTMAMVMAAQINQMSLVKLASSPSARSARTVQGVIHLCALWKERTVSPPITTCHPRQISLAMRRPNRVTQRRGSTTQSHSSTTRVAEEEIADHQRTGRRPCSTASATNAASMTVVKARIVVPTFLTNISRATFSPPSMSSQQRIKTQQRRRRQEKG